MAFKLFKNGDELWIWGGNNLGQLGDGTTEDRAEAEKVMDDVAAISMGGRLSAALKKDGTLWVWGQNNYGQVGIGSTEDYIARPVKVMDDVASVSVSLAGMNVFAIKTDGSLWAWGWNINGQLGDGTETNRSEPVKIMDGVAAVSCGSHHSAALKKDGTFWTWGYSFDGALGLGDDRDSRQKLSPTQVTTTSEGALAPHEFTSFDIGSTHSAALSEDGTLWMWGMNERHQLGDGTRKNDYVPTVHCSPK